jgi:hypothetical protein
LETSKDKLLSLALLIDSIDDKISVSKLYANIIITDPVYDAIAFEKKMIEQVYSSLSRNELLIKKIDKETIHVITRPYSSGGHTRLCERLSQMDATRSDLLIVDSADATTIKRLEPLFNEIKRVFEKDAISKIEYLIESLSSYKKLILHIHPDDILTVIAIGVLKKLQPNITVYFVNHSDHVFCFGKSIIDVMFQISYRGYETDNLIKHKAYVSSFLGIPLNVDKKPSIFDANNNSVKNIIVAGFHLKMKPIKNMSLPKILLNYLKENKGVSLAVIGYKYTNHWWWPLKLRFINRIKLHGTLPYEQYLNVIRTCDTCIDTAPITGGTAFVEMYLNSLRPIGFNSGIYGYTPMDIVKIDNIVELQTFTPHFHDALYENIKIVHGLENVQERYLAAINEQRFAEIHESLVNKNNDLDLLLSNKKPTLYYSRSKLVLKLKSVALSTKVKVLFEQFNLFSVITFLPKEVLIRLINLFK